MERLPTSKTITLVGYVEDLIYTPELNYAPEFLRGWRSTIEVSTALGQIEAVRSGAGIGVLHDFMAAAHPELVRLFPEQTASRAYWTVWHENMRVAYRPWSSFSTASFGRSAICSAAREAQECFKEAHPFRRWRRCAIEAPT